MKRKIICQDQYEAQKLASFIFVGEEKGTYISEILNVVKNEIVILLKDKSAHSILLKDESQVGLFVDFIQSVIDKEHQIKDVINVKNEVEILKE